MVDFAFLIPGLPLLGFAVLVLFGKKLGDPKAGWIGFGAVAGAFIVTLLEYLEVLTHIAVFRQQVDHLFTWVSVGSFHAEASLLLDPLSLTMALFVTGVSALIHLYSIGYMKGDPRFHQFFVYMNLFVFSMLTLVLADNFLLMFLGWEGVGACSYFLISFWFERPTAATAGKKAFVVNRVGDVGLLAGMFLTFGSFGTLTYYANGSGVFEQIGLNTSVTTGTVTAIALLLFLGAIGKSAQFPLHVWLADAMEGPTPVSALIHAATMVTAGVYLMVRAAPLLNIAPHAADVVAIVGAGTALFAATIACAQDDIKRVLAYSTLSQLGYMFLAVGAQEYSTGIFHMVTHAFFKALLFLSAGAVIHALHDQQDLKKMGNLRKWLPVTYVCFGIGWLAICGIPPFAGFWSKDEVLLAAWSHGGALFKVLWAIATFTVLLTAYYMSRLFFLAFMGDDRWKTTSASKAKTKHEEPVVGHSGNSDHGNSDHGNVDHGNGKPHESPRVMLVPMLVLAFLSVVGGFLNVSFPPIKNVIDNWLSPVAGLDITHVGVATSTKVWLDVLGVVLAVAGVAIAYAVARASARNVKQPWPKVLEPKVLARAWFIDPLYSWLFEKPGRLLAGWAAYAFDNRVIDGMVNGAGRLVEVTGGGLRKLQTGYVRNYALGIAGGTALLLLWVILRSTQ